MKKNEVKKLRLSRETLRELEKSDIRKAVGMSHISGCVGTRDDSIDNDCDSGGLAC